MNKLSIVVLGLAAVSGSALAANTSPVLVTNTGAAQAVPTQAQGTTSVSGSVSITGTPNVTVTNLPATQAVTVGNFPSTQAVSVSNFPTTQSVNVANSATAPVQVVDVERIARVPYLSSVYHNNCTTGPGACFFVFATPPSGTRLVAENLSGYFQIDSTVTAPVVGYVEDDPSFTLFTAFTAPLAGPDGAGHTQAAFSQPTRFYVNGGDTFLAVVSTTWSNGAANVVLSGYLENCSVTGCPAIAH